MKLVVVRSRLPRVRRQVSLLAVLAATASCTGTIGGGENASLGDDSAGGNGSTTPFGSAGRPGGGSAGTGGTSAPPTAAACAKSLHPGPSPMRRLTRFEYNNTVRDLLGDTTRPADAFPPEEKGNGFGNDATALSVSRLLAENYALAAKSVAQRATPDVTKAAALTKCSTAQLASATGEDTCAKAFIADFGARAFRRPLETAEADKLFSLYQLGRMGADFRTGIETVINGALQMPQFLYRVEMGTPAAQQGVLTLNPYEMASRLSYMLWGTMPDGDLFAAAKAGKLTSKDDIRAQAERMLKDDKAKEIVRTFNGALFGLVGLDKMNKNVAAFPKWTADIGPLFRREIDTFLDDVIWNGAGDLGSMLTARHTFLNAKLAAFYGVTGPKGDAFERVDLDAKRHAGFITSGGILSTLTPGTQTNPVLRGVFVRLKLLCDPPPDPPASLMVSEPKADPTLSTRERFAAHQTESSCKGCHMMMDPVGYGFENFDGVGLWRDTDNNKPVDARGNLAGTDVDGDFDGAGALMTKLASSNQVRGCFADQWFTYAYGRGHAPEDDCTRAALKDAFAKSGFKVRDLLLALTQTDTFLYKSVMP